MSGRKRICILALSPIRRDARVLRQIEYLAPDYDLTVVGEGDPPDIPGLTWIRVQRIIKRSGLFGFWDSITTLVLLLLGKFFPIAYRLWYFTRPAYRAVMRAALDSQADAFLANDWETVPTIAIVARRTRVKWIVDLAEYVPLENEENRRWLFLTAPALTYLLRTFVPFADASIVVCQPIADRYAQELGFSSIVIMNTPRAVELMASVVEPERIQLVTHGTAAWSRRIDWVIEAVGRLDRRFHLHLYLVGEPEEIILLRQIADMKAHGRVTFHDPVSPDSLVRTLNRYDVGLSIIPPTNYSYYVSLPNKFFDYLNARLAVVIGKSPAMRELMDQYRFGVIVPEFTVESIVTTLSNLTTDDIMRMKHASANAARVLNADVEMAKLTALFRQLWDEDQRNTVP
ncbi:MAG: glycosyltransferase [Chloroflexota bacterium]|nr:glycosyltransferase [Chloroflexota bacterium]